MGIILKSDVSEKCSQAENEVKEALEALGRRYYEDNKDSTGAKYSEDLANVTSLEKKAVLWKQYHLKSENKRLCEKCKAIVPGDSIFCNKCGCSLETLDYSVIISEIAPKQQPQTESQCTAPNICPSCGKTLVDGAMFCEKCGTKIS